jgi:hypothetical protein
VVVSHIEFSGHLRLVAPAIRFLYACRKALKKANEPGPSREDDALMCG